MKLLILLGAVAAVAISALPANDYCLSCMTTMEAMVLLNREAKAVSEKLPPVNDIAVMLCSTQYFDVFGDFVREGCNHMLQTEPDHFKNAISGILETDPEIYAPHAAKLTYFQFAKEQCENKFKACSKNTFKSFHKQSDRSDCVACKIVIDEMSTFARITPQSNATHIMSTLCQTLAYKNQPGSWLEDFCFEFLDDHAGQLKELFSGPKLREIKDSAAICSHFDMGCPKKTKDL